MSFFVNQRDASEMTTAMMALRTAREGLEEDRPDGDDEMYDRAKWHMTMAEGLLEHVIFHLKSAGLYSTDDEAPKALLAQAVAQTGEGAVYFDTIGFSGPMLFTTFKDEG
jgi:hypothetical protein